MDFSGHKDTSHKILCIELLKCLAAIMITNSHFKSLYLAPFTPLGTFGATGNALFFFVSGYTIALSKQNHTFFEWYKRRLSRIYPSLLIWKTLISALLFGTSISWAIWLGDPYWFIKCILFYYILIYLILKYFIKYIRHLIIFSTLLSICYFSFMPLTHLSIYEGEFRFICFFPVMLLGIYCSTNKKQIKNKKRTRNILICIFSFIIFYTIQFIGKGHDDWKYYFQITSLFPLYSWLYYLYVIVNDSSRLNRILSETITGYLIRFIASLTLEIYLVGFVLVYTNFNNLFPLNLLIVFLIILSTAYFVKISSNLFTQLFSTKEFNLKNIFLIVK